MRRSWLIGLMLLIWSLILNVYHFGVFEKPSLNETEVSADANWYPRSEYGLNHLVLKGSPYGRGFKAGELTSELLRKQEEILFRKLKSFLKFDFLIQPAILSAILWFHDVPQYIPQARREEMFGVSKFAPHEFDWLADGFTRQLAYHGLHEVGQMMVDRGMVDMGCTVAAIPIGPHYVLGRNFDFEGGRIFDQEKILKWVFPDQGIPYVSVIWAGMVGAVTGVNEKGVYISVNAAGSVDWKRVGTPSTLVVLDVLERAENSNQAIDIVRNSQMFITEIFVVLDRSGKLFRIEKSPLRTEVIELHGPQVITNHLISPAFENDTTNRFRKDELTTLQREKRGLDRLKELVPDQVSEVSVLGILSVLRDKGVDPAGAPLHLGNRQAIDSLIATHSVIYDSSREILFVNEGPGVSGAFQGFDLAKSFANREPRQIGVLPKDPFVTQELFTQIRESEVQIEYAKREIEAGQCKKGLELLDSIPKSARELSSYYLALGDGKSCQNKKEEAIASWRHALSLEPAYKVERQQLMSRLAARGKI